MQEGKKHEGAIIVICAYKPKDGKEAELLKIVREHVPILRSAGLATEREAHIMKAQNGTIVEVFEWVSAKAIEEAHKHPTVLAMWKEFDEASTTVPVAELDESKHVYSDFEPI